MPDSALSKLKEAAAQASRFSYSPYSRFAVGAAVRGRSGRVFAACNVENASYGLTVCAERNAIFHAVAAGEEGIDELVLYTPTEEPTTPCGACRQVLVEFGAKAKVTCTSDGPTVLNFVADELLPSSFSL